MNFVTVNLIQNIYIFNNCKEYQDPWNSITIISVTVLLWHFYHFQFTKSLSFCVSDHAIPGHETNYFRCDQ